MAQSSITDVSIVLPSIDEVFRVLTFQGGYNASIVILGTAALGMAAGVVGTFSLLRKRALMGDALAHSTLPGLAIAFILAILVGANPRGLPLLLFGATLSGILGIVVVQFIVHHTRLTEDTAIGVVLSVFFGAGIVLLSIIQTMGTGRAGGLSHFIYGQTAAMTLGDVYVMLALAFTTLFLALCLFKEFRLVCFDQEFAGSLGWPVSIIDLIMMTLVVLVTVVGLQAVGMILVVALLIIPATAARFWTERLSRMLLIGAAIGAISGYLGASASTLLPRLPTGAVIVLTAGVVFIFSFLFAPARGVVAGLLRLMILRLKIAEDHLLREIFELVELESNDKQSVSLPNLHVIAGWSIAFKSFTLLKARIDGLIKTDHTRATLTLTDDGLKRAKQLTRNHRLWEEYLAMYGHIATSHVDYSADFVEHILSAELIRSLEEILISRGQLPDSSTALQSIHPVRGDTT